MSFTVQKRVVMVRQSSLELFQALSGRRIWIGVHGSMEGKHNLECTRLRKEEEISQRNVSCGSCHVIIHGK